MTDRVYMTRRGAVWHSDGACPTLDDELSVVGGQVRRCPPAEAETARPCLACSAPATEWTVHTGNVLELMNLIEPSKMYMQDVDGLLQCTGLTVREHRGVPRQVARFGDTIRLDGGRYHVTPQEQP